MRRKTQNLTAFLLALVLVFGMIPAAYAAGYSINVEAQEGAILPYWVFERAGDTDSAEVQYLAANKNYDLPAGENALVVLAVLKDSKNEVSCGISINGMYYVQSVTLDHPDFFTGTVEIRVGKDAQREEKTWGVFVRKERSNSIGEVRFIDGTFTADVNIAVTPMTAEQAAAAQKQNQRQVVPKGKYTLEDISEAIQGIMAQKRSVLGLSETDNLLSGDELTYAGSTAADWLPIGLSRCGVEDDYDAYLAALQTYVEQKYREPDKLDRVKATEWHRISLAVLACGGDPTHFGKDENGNDINLIADGVYDRGKTMDIGAQGLNGWLWGLITLDSMTYNIPPKSSYTRMEMVKKILSFQLPDNGFNLRFAQGSTADPDITAMAIQALAPYYWDSTFNVKDPVDKALSCLSELQLDTGDFRSWGTRNSESVSQIIVALCSIGIDPQNDPRFIKNGINLLDALFYYQQEDGGFAHSYDSDPGNPFAIAGESNSMATNQALLALAAVWRQAQGMGILYDFRGGSVSAKILTPEESDVSFAGSYEFTEADRQQADALPKKLSTENDEEVTALLNKLKMSRDFDGYDTYMTKLTQAKSDIDALYAEIEAINTDIQEQIIPMTEPGLGEKPTVDRLVKRYKALSDHDKDLVQNWDAVLAVKAQTDAAQRNLFLIIGGVVVVMVAVTVVIRRRRESK